MIVLPGPDCKVRYAAIRETTDVREIKPSIMMKQHGTSSIEMQRAVLLVHEIIHMERSKNGAELASKQIRYLVGATLANNLPAPTDLNRCCQLI